MKTPLLLASILALAAAPPAGGQPRSAPRVYEAELLPLNGSLVTGAARVSLKGRLMGVELELEGLEPQRLHRQHLHGFFGRNRPARCPTVEDDADGDQVLDAEEALAVTGGSLLPLEPFPLPADDGPIRYRATFTVDSPAAGPLEHRVIVIRGLTLDGAYQSDLPVACGELRRAAP